MTRQQENARAHTGRHAREYLAMTLPRRMIRPPKSPDLSQLDFAINAHIKAEVAEELPEISTPEMVRAATKKVMRNRPQSCVDKVIDWFPARLRECVAQNGGHIEHAIWVAELRRGVDLLRRLRQGVEEEGRKAAGTRGKKAGDGIVNPL